MSHPADDKFYDKLKQYLDNFENYGASKEHIKKYFDDLTQEEKKEYVEWLRLLDALNYLEES